LFAVLHPRYKLEYFKKVGWLPDWIDVAEELVRKDFDNSYAREEDADEVPTNEPGKVRFSSV
jgi:hypothetical protein